MKKISAKKCIVFTSITGIIMLVFLALLGNANIVMGKEMMEYYLPLFKAIRDDGSIFSQKSEISVLGSITRDVFFSELRPLNLIFMLLSAMPAYIICFALKLAISIAGLFFLSKEVLKQRSDDSLIINILLGLAVALIPVNPYYWFAIAILPFFVFLIIRLINDGKYIFLLGFFLIPFFSEFFHIGIYMILGMLVYFIAMIIIKKRVYLRLLIADLLMLAGFALTEYRFIRLIVNEECSFISNVLSVWKGKDSVIAEVCILLIVLAVIFIPLYLLKLSGNAEEGMVNKKSFVVSATAFLLLVIIPFGNNPFTNWIISNESLEKYYAEEFFGKIKAEINYKDQWVGGYGIPSSVLSYNDFRVVDGELPIETDYSKSYVEDYSKKVISKDTISSEILPLVNVEEYKEFDGRLIFASAPMEDAANNGWVLLGNYSDENYPHEVYVYQTESRYSKREHSNIPFEDRSDYGYDGNEVSATFARMNEYIDKANEYKDEHPDLEDEELLKSLDVDGFIDAYHAIWDACNQVETAYWIANIQSDTDIYDEEAGEKAVKYYSDLIDYYDQLNIVAREAAKTPYRLTLDELIGKNVVEGLLEYEDMTEEEKEINVKLESLGDEYQVAANDEYYFDYDGHTWTFSEYNQKAQELDSDASRAIYCGLYDEKAKVVGEIYRETIQLRSKLVEEEDYDNFVDMSYEETYHRDYSSEDISKVFGYIKAASKYANEITASVDALSQYDPGCITTDDRATFEMLYPYINDIDSELGTSMEHMLNNNLFNLSMSDTKANSGYSIGFKTFGDAYIFDSPYGMSTDLFTYIHEFGHYNNYYYVEEKEFQEYSTQDISEIQSQGLELLMASKYNQIFDEETATYLECKELSSLIDSVINGAIVAEFEIYAYEHPNATDDELSEKMLDIYQEYGVYTNATVDKLYFWTDIPHLYSAPMYYVSYMTSALAALQLYSMSYEDYDLAVEKYMEISTLRSYWTYRSACEYVGMEDIFKKGTIENIIKNIYDIVDEKTGRLKQEADE